MREGEKRDGGLHYRVIITIKPTNATLSPFPLEVTVAKLASKVQCNFDVQRRYNCRPAKYTEENKNIFQGLHFCNGRTFFVKKIEKKKAEDPGEELIQ